MTGETGKDQPNLETGGSDNDVTTAMEQLRLQQQELEAPRQQLQTMTTKPTCGDQSNGSASATAGNSADTNIAAVAVRVPPFWPNDPALWFVQLEGQFALAKITSDLTKYNYVVGHLDHRFASEVRDIMTNPPNNDKYKAMGHSTHKLCR